MLDAWLLAFCRVAPVAALHPVFGARAVPRQIMVGTAAALACAVASSRGPAAVASGTEFVALALREVAAGSAIGLLGQAVFGAIEAAGRFVDDARGANVAHLYAPQLEAVASPLGQLELTASLAIFWGLGLHGPLIGAVCGDAGAVTARADALEGVLATAGTLARAALALGGPAAACCVLVDLLMGLVGRGAPSANVFLLSQPVKLTAAVLVTALGAPARVEAWGRLWAAQLEWISRVLGR